MNVVPNTSREHYLRRVSGLFSLNPMAKHTFQIGVLDAFSAPLLNKVVLNGVHEQEVV